MNTVNVLTKISMATAGAAVISLGVAGNAQASLVLDVNPGGAQAPCGSCGNVTGTTFGWGFDVTSSLTVDGIGVWDTGSNGIGTPVQAGLWTSTGTLLASVSISDSSTPVASASSSGQWLFEDIAQLTLNPGSYLIGSIFYNSTPTANIGSFTTIPEITNIVGRIGTSPNGGFQAPTNSFGIPIFGPTLRQATSQSVPEPASLIGVLGLGAVGVTSLRKRKATVQA
jgi:hypothetical protein